jgi:hypothetical protein
MSTADRFCGNLEVWDGSAEEIPGKSWCMEAWREGIVFADVAGPAEFRGRYEVGSAVMFDTLLLEVAAVYRSILRSKLARRRQDDSVHP